MSETEYIHQLEGWLAQVRARSESLLTERNGLQAELAALKARRCTNCNLSDDPENGIESVCDIYNLHVRGWGWEKAFSCSRWAEREKP